MKINNSHQEKSKVKFDDLTGSPSFGEKLSKWIFDALPTGTIIVSNVITLHGPCVEAVPEASISREELWRKFREAGLTQRKCHLFYPEVPYDEDDDDDIPF